MFASIEEFGLKNYRVSKEGIVQRCIGNTWKDVGLKKTRNGYWFENRLATKRYINVAEVVLTVFDKSRPPNHEVEYKNGNRHDVNLTNLCWSIGRKCCSRCKCNKPTEEFHNKKNRKSIYCKDCQSRINGCSKRLVVPTVLMSEQQKGYLAGLVDGEGWIGIRRTISKKSGHYNYVANIAIGNTSDFLLAIKEEFGIGNIIRRKAKKRRHKNSLVWVLCANAVRAVLPSIATFLRIKHKQGQLMLEYLSLVSKANIREFREKYLAEADRIYKELKRLNKKGTDITAPSTSDPPRTLSA